MKKQKKAKQSRLLRSSSDQAAAVKKRGPTSGTDGSAVKFEVYLEVVHYTLSLPEMDKLVGMPHNPEVSLDRYVHTKQPLNLLAKELGHPITVWRVTPHRRIERDWERTKQWLARTILKTRITPELLHRERATSDVNVALFDFVAVAFEPDDLALYSSRGIGVVVYDLR